MNVDNSEEFRKEKLGDKMITEQQHEEWKKDLIELHRFQELLKTTKTFLLRLEAISICGKICCTTGHIYTMRKKLEQALNSSPNVQKEPSGI